MRYDLLVHVDSDDASILNLAISNITNYINALPESPWNVVVLANGPAVRQFTTANLTHGTQVSGLAQRGVKFHLCRNAVMAFGIAPEAVLPGCEVVPAGMVELVTLQNEGYAYIKP